MVIELAISESAIRLGQKFAEQNFSVEQGTDGT
jgi:hypothetical protein